MRIFAGVPLGAGVKRHFWIRAFECQK